MPSAENKAIALRTYKIISSGNLDALDEIFHLNFVDHNPQAEQKPGREGLKQMFASVRVAFPDLHFSVEDLVSDGDKIVARLTMSGTHRGVYKKLPGTGKQISIPVIDILQITDGKVVERWGLEDELACLQQLAGGVTAGLAKLGKAAVAVAIPITLVWAWRNGKLPLPWS